MKIIDFETIKSCIKGTQRVIEKDDKLLLRRFTEKQEEYFEQTLNYVNKPLKAKASSSMVLDFNSNTQNFEMILDTTIATTRDKCYVDVYADNKLVSHCGYLGFRDGNIVVKAQFDSGEKHITVYLPNLFDGQIVSVKLDKNASFKPYQNKRKFLFLGDSITQGYVAEYPSLTYVNAVAREFDALALNNAIGGAYFWADDLDENIDFKPDVVFVAYGTNDWAHGYDIEQNATEYFEKLTKVFGYSKIIYITPIWRGDVATREDAKINFESVGPLIKKVCAKFENISVIDGYNLVGSEKDNFILDYLHPNDKGFMEYSKNLIDKLKEKKLI